MGTRCSRGSTGDWGLQQRATGSVVGAPPRLAEGSVITGGHTAPGHPPRQPWWGSQAPLRLSHPPQTAATHQRHTYGGTGGRVRALTRAWPAAPSSMLRGLGAPHAPSVCVRSKRSPPTHRSARPAKPARHGGCPRQRTKVMLWGRQDGQPPLPSSRPPGAARRCGGAMRGRDPPQPQAQERANRKGDVG
jgi:hypothetical protein